jgi:hypothetical protein
MLLISLLNCASPIKIKISYHLINLCIASQQTTVKITEIMIKIRNSVQETPIKSLNILKNSTKIYKNIITKMTAFVLAIKIGYPCEKAGNL